MIDAGLGVFDARRQRARSKTTKHHRVDRADARAGQHGKGRLGNHGHVDQDPVALAHAQLFQHRRHALHFGVQLAKRVNLFLIGLGRDKNQRRLVGTVFQMTVHRVVAQVGHAAHKPLGKRRVAVVANLAGLHLPVHQLGLFAPESVAVRQRSLVKFGV